MEEFLSELTQIRKSALEDMVKNAVVVLENKDLIVNSIFNNNDIIINFNYTPQLKYYMNVCHFIFMEDTILMI